MKTGHEVLREISAKLSAEKSALNKIISDESAAQHRRQKVEHELAQTIEAFAGVHVDAIAGGEHSAAVGGHAKKVNAILAERESEYERLTRAHADSHADFQAAEDERRQAEAATQAAAAQLDAKRPALEEALATDEEYQSLVAARDQVRHKIETINQRFKDARRDREEKREPYEQDPLFMYLYKRDFGTAEYAGKGLSARLDAWVAGLIRYPEAVRNYEMLLALPAFIRDEVGKSYQAEYAEIQERLKKRFHEAATRVGYATLESAHALCAEAEAEATRKRDNALALYTETTRAVAAFVEGTDEHTKNARKLLKNVFAEKSVAELMRAAQATVSDADDGLVDKIHRLRQKSESCQDDVAQWESKRRSQEARIRRLEELQRDFKAKGYADAEARFDSFDLSDVLIAYIAGNLSARDSHRIFEQHHSVYRPDDSFDDFDDFGSGGGFGSGGFGSGGGFGGGGFGTGGGFSGGGFRTGGGF